MGAQTPSFAETREVVARTCRELSAAGLVRGTSGNVSARCDGGVAVSATGAVLAELEPEQVTLVDADGAVLDGDLAPTSELGMHLAIYARHPWVGGVVHTHAPTATALSCVLDELPVVHYEMLALGGSVRVAPYATYGTAQLAANALDALEGRTVALLANHGTIAMAPDLAGAQRSTELLEWLAEVYWRASAVGTPRALDAAQQQDFIDRATSTSYGTTKGASR